jgi:hypothetical protein
MFFLMRLEPEREEVLFCPDSRILSVERVMAEQQESRQSTILKPDRGGKEEKQRGRTIVEPEIVGAIL